MTMLGICALDIELHERAYDCVQWKPIREHSHTDMPSLLREAGRYDRLIKRFEKAVRDDTMSGSYAKEDRDDIKRELREARKALRNFVQR